MLTVTTLASGSSGNSVLVSCGDSHILLDAGISARRITNGLKAAGVQPEDLDAIFITHDHHDHVNGLQVLTKKLRVPVAATPETCKTLEQKAPNTQGLLTWMGAGEVVTVGGFRVKSFPTWHDTAGSVGFQVATEDGSMALCTDLGCVTDEVKNAVRGCDLLICEANHDVDWVKTSRYPYYLKQRITGQHGHLSNEQGGDLAAYAVEYGTRNVILAHLSAENNTPAHAYQAVSARLRAAGIDPKRDLDLSVAPRSESGPTYEVEHEEVREARKIC